MKEYELSAWGKTFKLHLVVNNYMNNGRIALEAFTDEDEPFATISVNLPHERYCPEGHFFVDSNNCPWVEEWLEANGIAEPTEYLACSGFCAYELYKLNMDAI